jgi:N-acetylglutamate synthase-like GNAT family acetyltransferase
MELTFRSAGIGDYDQIRRLVIDTGWGKRVQDPDRFRRMMDGADRTIVALDGDHVVGFARALFDDASNGYISMVAVAGDRQGQGIGRELVKRLMDVKAPKQITWVLRSARDSTGFWEKMGFRKSDVAMEIVRTE